MGKIKLSDVDMNVDYEDLGFIESTFMHDMKRMGIVKCLEKYINELSSIEFGSDTAYNYTVCLLRYFGNPLGVDVPFELKPAKKWVLDPHDALLFEFMNDDERRGILSQDSISVFRDAHIILYEVGGSVNA